MPEKELQDKARRGDIEAFSALVKIYEKKAVHVAYSFLGDWEEARDAAQEAFIKAYQGLSRFKGESKFSTWLYRILANQCKDRLRKKKMRTVPLFEESRDEESTQRGLAPSEVIASRELGQAIQTALNDLPFQQKTAFTFRYLEGLSLEEIASLMGLSTGAVKAHLWQAGVKMKKSLQSFAEERRMRV